MANDTTFVIIGAGHAGGRAAEAMRRLEFTGHIVLVGEEPHLPYERPPLSKELLQAPDGGTFRPIRDQAYYNENRIECRLGTPALAIDRKAQRVTLAGGETIAYDKLLLTTGGRVRRLDVPGSSLSGIHYLRTIDDSRAIHRGLAEGAHVVVVGGGFIGLEVAASARMRGCRVTVIEATDRLMGRAVPPEVSQTFRALHEAHGVALRFSTFVDRFEGAGRLEHVVTMDGERLAADMAVVGIGIVPETALAHAAGIVTEEGIVVDEYCRSSDPTVFAAGDATRHFNPLLGRHIRLESWQNAQNQAIAAARVMCDEEQPFAEVPWMWSDQFDANLQIAGCPDHWDDTVVRGDPDGSGYILFHIADDKPAGAIAVNRPRDMRFARRLIEAGKSVDRTVLADDAVLLRDIARGA